DFHVTGVQTCALPIFADGEDGGYLQYVTGNNAWIDVASLYGGGPYGSTLQTWSKKSPGFRLENVRAPLRITVLKPYDMFTDWEWFHGLTDLHKAVDMILLMDGEHFLKKPAERLSVGEANVDWFDFWLNHREDPTAAKRPQYGRWENLRRQQPPRHAM